MCVFLLGLLSGNRRNVSRSKVPSASRELTGSRANSETERERIIRTSSDSERIETRIRLSNRRIEWTMGIITRKGRILRGLAGFGRRGSWGSVVVGVAVVVG